MLLLALSGCTLPNEIRLHQPQAPPIQRALRLTSTWAYFQASGARLTCLLAFPLPGAVDGPRDFLIYLSAPAGAGPIEFGQSGPDAPGGFLIQATGLRRGKTVFVGGSATVGKPFLDPHRRALELDVACDDGSRITGRALLSAAPEELRRFERRYAGDIALLAAPASQPATQRAPAATAPRP
jgi:hypothetical protein